MGYLFTSESVTSGHPDKLSDFISDSILDECLRLDPNARVAIEVFIKGIDIDNMNTPKSYIIIGGEISLNSEINIDYENIARNCMINIGYTNSDIGMNATNAKDCEVIVLVNKQSEEISQGVNALGAGDQGIIFGYATNESENFKETEGSFMPLPIILAHRLTSEITKRRLEGTLDWARPDGKSQVTIAYNDDGFPQYVDTVVIAIQHDDLIGKQFKNVKLEQKFITQEVKKKIIHNVIPKKLINSDIKIIINGTGRFCKGGPYADAGLTGRKIIVDTYGGSGRHGGGAFSGKDPTKVDRSAAYAARWAAKHIVASGLVKECEIQLSYSIGITNPISINSSIKPHDLEMNKRINRILNTLFDFTPSGIIKELDLKKPIYSQTTSGGHFGRNTDNGFPWEKLNENLLEKIREFQ